MTSLTFGGRILSQVLKQNTLNQTLTEEDVMNTKQIVLAALLIGASAPSMHAQTFYPVLRSFTPSEMKRMDRALAVSLQSWNFSVVESALAIVTKVKLDVPSADLPRIREQVFYLSSHSPTPKIRFKACLANSVFSHPQDFKAVSLGAYDTPDAFFSALDMNASAPILSSK